MSFIGSFGMFTTVRLGIYTSQQGLNLTGNNIANINTVGYTRQTLDIKSMNATGVDRYMDSNTRIGSGAYVTGISQMRDPYLDIRYRTECASVGYMDTKLSNLNDLAAILDEVGDGDDENGIISAQLNDLFATLENLTEYTGQGEFDTQVRSSASSLVALFNSYASKLNEVEVNAVDRFEKDLITVNELLKNIKSLNTNIQKCDVHGAPALEMRDERNRLIDELSQYIKIDVQYTMEKIGPALEVEKLSIKLGDSYPGTYLIDGIYGGQLQLDKTMPAINPSYDSQALPYLDDNGNPTDDIAFQNTRNPDSLPYLDTNNKPVATADEAAQLKNTNYNLTLTALTDTKGLTKVDYLGAERPVTIDLNAATFKDGTTVDLTAPIKALTDSGKDSYSWLVDDGNGNQSLYQLHQTPDEANPGAFTYSLVRTAQKASVDISLGDNALYGSLQAAREFLTETGEFATQGYNNLVDPNAATKRGIGYYQNALDLLARKFADTMNAANDGYRYSLDSTSGKYFYVDKDGNSLGIEKKSNLSDLTEAELETLKEKGSRPDNCGILFSNCGDNNDSAGITAANISISADWASGDVQIVNSYEVIPGTNKIGSTDNTNILHMVTMMSSDLTYTPSDMIPDAKKDAMFIGSFGEMLGNINAVLGNDQKSTQIMLDNYYESAVELDTGRDAVSSVDLNDETVNMIQYQKSYSAACRLMTTMDEILDKLINGTGVAGR